MNEVQKMTVDEYEVSKAMQTIFKAMELLAYALIDLGVVADPMRQYDTEDTPATQ